MLHAETVYWVPVLSHHICQIERGYTYVIIFLFPPIVCRAILDFLIFNVLAVGNKQRNIPFARHYQKQIFISGKKSVKKISV